VCLSCYVAYIYLIMAYSFSLLRVVIGTVNQFVSLACYSFLSINRRSGRRIIVFVYGVEDEEMR